MTAILCKVSVTSMLYVMSYLAIYCDAAENNHGTVRCVVCVTCKEEIIRLKRTCVSKCIMINIRSKRTAYRSVYAIGLERLRQACNAGYPGSVYLLLKYSKY